MMEYTRFLILLTVWFLVKKREKKIEKLVKNIFVTKIQQFNENDFFFHNAYDKLIIIHQEKLFIDE